MSGKLKKIRKSIYKQEDYITVLELESPIMIMTLHCTRSSSNSSDKCWVRLTKNGIASEHQVPKGKLIGIHTGSNFPGPCIPPETWQRTKVEIKNLSEVNFVVNVDYFDMTRV
jgi:hypothetical protein